MTQIVLNDEQSRLVDLAEGPVCVLDSRGRQIGLMTPCAGQEHEPGVLSRELTDEVVHRMCEERIEWRTTDQVLERLKSLRKA